MIIMLRVFSIATLALCASAYIILPTTQQPPLSVELTTVGNSKVQACVINTGTNTIQLLNKGTLLDEEAPIKKLNIYSGNNQIPFEGLHYTLDTDNFSLDDFDVLPPGASQCVVIEAAALHAVNHGGEFIVSAKGSMPFVGKNWTNIAGTYDYESNRLIMRIDSRTAAKIEKAIDRRQTIGPTCTGENLTTIQTSLTHCHKYASAAASAALLGKKLLTYFKSNETSVRTTVAARLKAVAADCAGGATTITTSTCVDMHANCRPYVVAYTISDLSQITYCPQFFRLPSLNWTCHSTDQTGVIIHEETHNAAVYSPNTIDISYGYPNILQLGTEAALDNADTYRYYTTAVRLDCDD